jgi:hypothetical protein
MRFGTMPSAEDRIFTDCFIESYIIAIALFYKEQSCLYSEIQYKLSSNTG